MALLLAQLLLGIGMLIGNGRGLAGLPLVIAGVALLVRAVVRPADAAPPSPRALAWLLAAQAVACLVRDPSDRLLPGAPLFGFRLLALALLAPALLACLRPRAKLGPLALAAMCTTYAVTAALLIALSPHQQIDVFTAQQEGAAQLLAGHNPYRGTFTNPFNPDDTLQFFGDHRTVLDNYPYPPLSMFATAAGYALAGDVRWTMLVLQLGIAALLYLLAVRAGHGAPTALAVAALQLAHPRGLYVLQQSWTEPLFTCALLLALLWLVAEPERLRGAVALGLAFAAKQYSVLLLPWCTQRFGVRLRQLAVALSVAAAVTLPLALWDARAFVDDVVLFQLRQPFRMDAVSLPALVARLTGVRAPGALSFAGAAAAFFWSRRRLPPGPHGLALGAALTYAAFFLSAKQSFCNYWYPVGALLVAAVATAPQPQREAEASPEPAEAEASTELPRARAAG